MHWIEYRLILGFVLSPFLCPTLPRIQESAIPQCDFQREPHLAVLDNQVRGMPKDPLSIFTTQRQGDCQKDVGRSRDERGFNPHSFKQRGIEHGEIAALSASIFQCLTRKLNEVCDVFVWCKDRNRVLGICKTVQRQRFVHRHRHAEIWVKSLVPYAAGGRRDVLGKCHFANYLDSISLNKWDRTFS